MLPGGAGLRLPRPARNGHAGLGLVLVQMLRGERARPDVHNAESCSFTVSMLDRTDDELFAVQLATAWRHRRCSSAWLRRRSAKGERHLICDAAS